MPTTRNWALARGFDDATPTAIARTYFAWQAIAGALWWIAVFASDHIRRRTLGGWDPAIVVGPDVVLFVGASAAAAVTGLRTWAGVAAAWTTAVTVALFGYALVSRSAGWGAVFMSLATIGSIGAAATLWSGRLPTAWFFLGPFRFRPARAGAAHLRRGLIQLVVFWTAFFVLVPTLAAATERRLRVDWSALDTRALDVVGAAAFTMASALGLWSCVTMARLGEGTPLPAETARKLVVAGPYRFLRNPMATAGAIQTASVGLWEGSWIVVAMAIAGALAWNRFIRPREEADLVDRFGAPYEQYRLAVRCWIPW